MNYVNDWPEIKERFSLWWQGRNADRPLMHVVAVREAPLNSLEEECGPETPEALYLDVDANLKRCRNYCRTRRFYAEAYPNLSLDLGPGSMALYLGAEPVFTPETVWFRECARDAADLLHRCSFGPENKWWKLHCSMIRRAVEATRGEFLVNIPDIIENVDILAAMRGPQNLLYDMIDEPALVREAVGRIEELYFRYYDAMYDLVKDEDGSNSFTAFQIVGSGKTAKVQCDFSALMSPDQFREIVQPSLSKQCRALSHSLYHLDGPDALRHVDALMEIGDLQALQWTCGAGQPDGSSDRWFPLYDKVRKAGKSLWIQLYDGGFRDWLVGAEMLVRRYGKDGLYLYFPEMKEAEAEELIRIAERRWR